MIDNVKINNEELHFFLQQLSAIPDNLMTTWHL